MYDSDNSNLHHYDQSLLLGNKYQSLDSDVPTSINDLYNQSVHSRPADSYSIPSISESFSCLNHDHSTSQMAHQQGFPQQSTDIRNYNHSSTLNGIQSNTRERCKLSAISMLEENSEEGQPSKGKISPILHKDATNPHQLSHAVDDQHTYSSTSPISMLTTVNRDPLSPMEDAISNAWRLWSMGMRSVGALPMIDENLLEPSGNTTAHNNEQHKIDASNIGNTFGVADSHSKLGGNLDINTYKEPGGSSHVTLSSSLVPEISHTGAYHQYTTAERSSDEYSNEVHDFLNRKTTSDQENQGNGYSFNNSHMITDSTGSCFESHIQSSGAYSQVSLAMPYYQTTYSTTANLDGNPDLNITDGRFITSYTPPTLDALNTYSGRKRAHSDSIAYSSYIDNEMQPTTHYNSFSYTRNKRFKSMDLMYTNHGSTELPRYTQVNKYFSDNRTDSLDDTYFGVSIEEYKYPIPWGPALDQTLSMPLFDIAPSDIGNPDARPRRQKVRFDGDLYTPQWVRYNGQAKEGFCQHCKPGKWLQLKNSAYWYHVQFYHGISATSGRYYRAPLQMNTFENGIKGLCHQCREVVAVCHTKKKDMALWFRHAHKCHVHHKPKSLKKH